jgi:ribonuclease J
MKLPRRDVMIIATGGQGEARAALARIAFEQHKISVEKDDLVIFSSKQIPGNEIAIGRIQNALAEKGVRMITDRQAPVHVSGHPGRPELAAMYEWIRPEIIVPVHGEMRHLMEHARFAQSRGVPHGIVQTNGDLVRLAPGGPAKIGEERVGRLILDGDVILSADGPTMNERRKLSFGGIVSVAIALDGQGQLRGGAEIALLGIPSRRIAKPFSKRPAPPQPRQRDGTAATRTSCASRCASPSAAARPTGPARSRWSKCWSSGSESP